MAYVVGSACEGCKDTSCVTACPVEAFREDATRVYIDPEICIDCSACVSECPVEAIFEEYDAPPGEEQQVELNRERAASGECPPILERRATAGRRS